MSARDRNAIRYALTKGEITRPSRCDECGKAPEPRRDGRPTIQARLPNGPARPLAVVWLCIRCNSRNSKPRAREDITERFWRHVDKRGSDECWPWKGSRLPFGYGQFPCRSLSITKAHQASWHIHNGSRGDKCVLHSCDNPWCVNPKHLWLGTKAENNLDKTRKGRNRNASGARISLSDQQIAALLKARAAGAPYARLARMVNISERSVVRAIAAAIAAGGE